MGLAALKTGTDLKAMQCGTCGVWHAIPQAMYDTFFNEGGFWYCPNGHQRGFSQGSIYKQLEQEKKRREWAEQSAKRESERADSEERRRIAQKAATTRLRNRAKAGLCPCCNRHFSQLANHMVTKHPDFPNGEQDA